MTQAGARLGRYELRGVLGQGGFARVFRAWDPALGRELAIKALLPHLAEDAAVRGRFIAEARALAALHHPHIVTVHDVGEADGIPFIAMELVNGETLAQMITTRGPQPPWQAAPLLSAVASALDYLHAAGMVHRDLKAANIMRDQAGRVVLMDFGIARHLSSSVHTLTGTVLGTPETMAPEQVRGEPAGPPADIYALGILTFQLLTGSPPFTGGTARVLYAQVNEPPPLAALPPGLPPSVPAALAAALAKEPAARPATAGAFVQALGAATPAHTRKDASAARTLTATAPPAPPAARSRGLTVLLLAGSAAALLAVMLVLALSRGSPEAATGPGNNPAAGPKSTGGGGAGTVTGRPSPAATRALSVSNLVVHDQVVAPGSRRDAFVVLGSNVVACFRYQPGAGSAPLVLVATREDRAPGGPDDPAVVARSQPVQGEGGDTCAPLALLRALPAPSTYHVWALAGTAVAGRGSFTAQATPAPTPPPTPSPTPPPAHRQGDLVRINTPGDCILIRIQPERTATALECKQDGGHLLILGGPQRSAAGEEWWPVQPFAGGREGWSLGLYLVPSPECTSRRTAAACDTEVRAATPPPATGGGATVNITGEWSFTDHIRYGRDAGRTYSFHVRLSQQGDVVTGTGDLALSGRLEGRTLRATYGQGGGSGVFLWTFKADGTRFEGSYTSSLGNGGISLGRRTTGAVSGADQATISVLVAGKPLDQTVRVGDEVYVCYTISRAGRVSITNNNTAFPGYQDRVESSPGDCAGPYAAGSGGARTYRIELRVNGQLVAQSSTTFEILR